ncbi:MAG: transglycosylase SLT domain-containing protein, partial [Gammaproteobacteria bacterium]|nr:transglycosylase SLT domain-containing protein [Gammaproteobacteria bacterium]
MISNSSINLKRLGLLLASLSLTALLYGCNALQSPFGSGLDLAVQTDLAEESVTQSADASSPVITIITYNEITMLQDPGGFIDFDSQLATAAETSMVVVVFKPQALYRDEPAGPDLSFKMAQTSASFEALRQAAIAELEKQSDAWYRLQQGMSLHSVDNKRVAVQLKWYLDHRGYLERVMQRAEPILPFILDELEKKNLPAELALLPVVESAYQSFAYSHGRASGLWQIIPSTGRFLGLKQNWWYDGRRDMIESTRAAIRYLDSLAKQFDG